MVRTMVLLGVLVVACKQHDTTNMLESLDSFSQAMCACKDKACADKVNADMTRWSQEMVRSRERQNPDPDVAKESANIMTKYVECMTKLMVPSEAGSPPPATK